MDQAFIDQFVSRVGFAIAGYEVKEFPDELVLFLDVSESNYDDALNKTSSLREEFTILAKREGFLEGLMVVRERDEAETDTEGKDSSLSSARYRELRGLLSERSRTSEMISSLNYVKDPRVVIEEIATTRPTIVFGRRGAGKTALLREIKDRVERQGHRTIWVNAHSYRNSEPEYAFSEVVQSILDVLENSFSEDRIERFRSAANRLQDAHEGGQSIANFPSRLNRELKRIFKDVDRALYIFIDDLYLMSKINQSQFLDYIFSSVRDSAISIKVASIEHLTRTFRIESQVGMQLSQDITPVNLDFNLESPSRTQEFLESVLKTFVETVGIGAISKFMPANSRGRLILASGGVPRDYLRLVASAIEQAVNNRDAAAKISTQDVNEAAAALANERKRDLRDDVESDQSQEVLAAIEKLSRSVRDQGFSFFRVTEADRTHENYDVLSKLVDLRFIHVVTPSLSAKSRKDQRFEGYTLNLSEFSERRLFSSLNTLDIVNGAWTYREVGASREQKAAEISASALRDKLLRSPVISMADLL